MLKTSLIISICLIIIVQAMAANAMSYHMVNMSMTQAAVIVKETQAVEMSHCDQSKTANIDTQKNIINDIGSQKNAMDCCEQDCQCSASGCANFATYISTLSLTPIYKDSNKVRSIDQIISNQPNISLYRPPIKS